MDFSSIVDFFSKKNFDAFYKWLREALRFYKSPREFVLIFEKKQGKDFIRSLLQYFFLFESIVILLAASLLDVFHFRIYAIFGFMLMDVLLAIPLVASTGVALCLTKTQRPFKKAAAFVLLFRFFLIIPFQVFLILFIFFENYAYLAGFLFLSQLVVLANVLLPGFFFVNRNSQRILAVLISAIGLLGIAFLSALNPLMTGKDDGGTPLDPIYSEFKHLKSKATIIGHVDTSFDIESLKKYRQEISKDMFYENFESLREDWIYRNELVVKEALFEKEYFINDNIYRFRTNKQRFSKYLEFIDSLLQCEEASIRSLDIIRLEMTNKTIEKDIESINKEIALLDEKKPSSAAELRQKVPPRLWPEIGKGKLWPLIDERLRKIEEGDLQEQVLKLHVNEQEKRVLMMDNSIKSLKLESEFYKLATTVEIKMRAFIEDEISYQELFRKISTLTFVI